MQNEKSVKSYPPPPEKFSYPHLIRVLAFALLFVFVFAFAGCTDSTEPPVEIETGTVKKYYDLYEPVSQIENIECDLYYEYWSRVIDKTNSNQGWVQFGSRTVDVWRTYKLAECENGSFDFGYTTSLRESDSDSLIAYYDYTLSVNYNSLQYEPFISPTYTFLDRKNNKRTDIKRCFYDNTEFDYYCTWVVDGVAFQHETERAHSFNREWTVRLYVLFVDSETTVTLHEYIFRIKYPCRHDENGNEIYNGDLCYDSFIYNRYISQSYEPPV